MESISEIRCFQHCQDVNLLCFEVPERCPLCFMNLVDCGFRVPPFCVPSPFRYHLSSLLVSPFSQLGQGISPFSVLIKPTEGSFLSDYTSGDDLHVGLTDSEGVVFGYDSRGVQAQASGWDGCLAAEFLELHDLNDENLVSKWDDALRLSLVDERWDKSRYLEDSHNCYSYALALINSVLDVNMSKSTFCQRHILPVTSGASKYVAIYRQILKKGTIISSDP